MAWPPARWRAVDLHAVAASPLLRTAVTASLREVRGAGAASLDVGPGRVRVYPLILQSS